MRARRGAVELVRSFGTSLVELVRSRRVLRSSNSLLRPVAALPVVAKHKAEAGPCDEAVRPCGGVSVSRALVQSPGRGKFWLASGGCNFGKARPWLGLVNLSRIPVRAFFPGGPSWLGNG